MTTGVKKVGGSSLSFSLLRLLMRGRKSDTRLQSCGNVKAVGVSQLA